MAGSGFCIPSSKDKQAASKNGYKTLFFITIASSEKLGVKADECLYVGDGGSYELEAEQTFGMQAVQAVWYHKEGVNQPSGRKEDFEHMEKPMDVIKIFKRLI